MIGVLYYGLGIWTIILQWKSIKDLSKKGKLLWALLWVAAFGIAGIWLWQQSGG